MSKVQNKSEGVVQNSAETPAAVGGDSLSDQQLSDPLTDPLAGPTQFLGGGPAVSAGGAPTPGSPSQGQSSAVMFKSGGGMSAGQVHQAAAEGISGGGGSLPFQGAIQQSFGGHDVSGVKAFTGGAASRANESMGSAAYTKGSSVAFKGAPDLHTTAHEAAHVVQQRAGVNVPGGVGQRGDSYERHADAVADTVVQGKSAAPMLDQFASGAKAATVQHSMGYGGNVQFMGLFERIGRGIGKGIRAVGNFLTGKSAGQAAFEEAEIFVNHGKYGPELYTPPTGVGGFDAEYYPINGPDGWQKVIINSAVKFISPVKMSGKNAIATEAGDKPSKKLAKAINTKPEAARPGLVAKYTWGGEKDGFLKKIESQVMAAWSFKHSFRVDKVGWKWVGADPSAHVSAREGDKSDSEHLQIKLYKVNNDPGALNAGTDMPSWEWKTGRNQLMRLDSNDFNTDPTEWGKTLNFENNVWELTEAQKNDLKAFTRTYQGMPGHAASANQKVRLTGGSSSRGSASANRELSNKRITAVRDEMQTQGWNVEARLEKSVNQGESQADQTKPDNAADRFVRLDAVGTGQTTVAHEFGHAFGLKDEYANKDKTGAAGTISGTGGQAGQDTGHAELAKKAGVEAGAIYENSENMMSVGNTVKPQHYATFHDALCKLTALNDWKLGKAISKQAARAEAIPDEPLDGQQGDFNVPTGDTRTA